MAGLLVIIVVATVQVAAYYDFEKLFPSSRNTSGVSNNGNGSGNGSRANTIEVYVLFNFGNGTVRWFNDSNVPAGWNFYNLTVYLANGNVNSDYYPNPPYQEHFVRGIFGIQNSGESYWALWLYCNNDRAWLYSNVGADLIRLSDKQTMAWYYERDPPSPPVSGSSLVSACSS